MKRTVFEVQPEFLVKQAYFCNFPTLRLQFTHALILFILINFQRLNYGDFQIRQTPLEQVVHQFLNSSDKRVNSRKLVAFFQLTQQLDPIRFFNMFGID